MFVGVLYIKRYVYGNPVTYQKLAVHIFLSKKGKQKKKTEKLKKNDNKKNIKYKKKKYKYEKKNKKKAKILVFKSKLL